MNYGKFILVMVVLLLIGLLYFAGLDGGAFSSFERILSLADAFVSAVSQFIKWLLP